MQLKVSRLATTVFTTLIAAFPATTCLGHVQPDDFQVWTYATVTAPLTEKVSITGDIHVGWTDNATKTSEVLIRPSLAYNLSDSISVGGGYTYLWYHIPGTGSIHEHRIFEDVAYHSSTEPNHLVITMRSRLEERFEEEGDGAAWRLRQLTRIDLPTGARNGLKLIVWNETFFSINSTAWAGRPRTSAMLNFIGVGVPLTKAITAEPGYLNFTTFSPGLNQSRHILAAFVSVRF